MGALAWTGAAGSWRGVGELWTTSFPEYLEGWEAPEEQNSGQRVIAKQEKLWGSDWRDQGGLRDQGEKPGGWILHGVGVSQPKSSTEQPNPQVPDITSSPSQGPQPALAPPSPLHAGGRGEERACPAREKDHPASPLAQQPTRSPGA